MTTYYRERHPVRKIPTKSQLEYAAKRQAMQEASRKQPVQEADPSYTGHYAGIHPEHQPYTTDNELEEDKSYYNTRIPTSARRYQGYDVSPEEIYENGNTRLHVRYVDVPKRSSRPKQLPPPRERYTEEVIAIPKAKRRSHPLLIFGIGMIAMLALWVVLSSAATWIQTTKDDLTYGRPRTFHIDAVVGHSDSVANPTHFIAINLNRHVEIIEQPGGDTSKMKVYQVTILFGDGEELTPVILTFADLLGNGKLDMLIHIHSATIAFINENGSFRPARPGEVKGLV